MTITAKTPVSSASAAPRTVESLGAQLDSLEAAIAQVLAGLESGPLALPADWPANARRTRRSSRSGLPPEPALRTAVQDYLRDAGVPAPTATLAEELGRAAGLAVENPRIWKQVRDRVASLLHRMQGQGLVENRQPMGPALWALPAWPVPPGPGRRRPNPVAGHPANDRALAPVPVGRGQPAPGDQLALPVDPAGPAAAARGGAGEQAVLRRL